MDEEKIKPLAESIKTVGLLNPISVLEDVNSYILIAGEHRLISFMYNKETTIPAVIYKRQYEDIEMDKARCLIMEADENLLRRTPDGHEESYLLWKRKEAYELLFPTPKTETIKKLKQDIKYRVENNLPYEHLEEELDTLENYKSFAKDTAEKLGVSEKTIRQKVRIGSIIDKETGEILDDLNVPNRILRKITIGDDEKAKVASKVYVDTIEKIDNKFETQTERNTFFENSFDNFKTEMNQQEENYHINHPIEFAESLKNKVEHEYLPQYEKNKNLIDGTMVPVEEEKLYLKKSDNLFFCTSSYLLKYSKNLSFTKGFINLYIDNESQFSKVTSILNLCDDEDKVLVEFSTDYIFTKYLQNIYYK